MFAVVAEVGLGVRPAGCQLADVAQAHFARLAKGVAFDTFHWWAGAAHPLRGGGAGNSREQENSECEQGPASQGLDPHR